MPLCAQPYDPSLWPDALPAAPHVLPAELPPRPPGESGAPVGRGGGEARLRSACHSLPHGRSLLGPATGAASTATAAAARTATAAA